MMFGAWKIIHQKAIGNVCDPCQAKGKFLHFIYVIKW